MSEGSIGTAAAISVAGLALGSYFYMLGGRSGKWKRRFIGSAILAATVNASAIVLSIWTWKLLLIYPALAVAFHLGYGADTTLAKLLRRIIFVLGVLSAGAVAAWALHAWGVFPFHALVAVGSIYLGVKNPIHAAAEEVFVCTSLNLGLCAYPFVS